MGARKFYLLRVFSFLLHIFPLKNLSKTPHQNFGSYRATLENNPLNYYQQSVKGGLYKVSDWRGGENKKDQIKIFPVFSFW